MRYMHGQNPLRAARRTETLEDDTAGAGRVAYHEMNDRVTINMGEGKRSNSFFGSEEGFRPIAAAKSKGFSGRRKGFRREIVVQNSVFFRCFAPSFIGSIPARTLRQTTAMPMAMHPQKTIGTFIWPVRLRWLTTNSAARMRVM
jgi:hypothetical protein